MLRTLLAANAEQLPDAHGVTPLCAAAAAKPWVLNPGKDGATRGTKQYQVIRTGNNLKAVRTLGFAWWRGVTPAFYHVPPSTGYVFGTWSGEFY